MFRVTDINGKALPNIKIDIKVNESNVTGDTTDVDGLFRIDYCFTDGTSYYCEVYYSSNAYYSTSFTLTAVSGYIINKTVVLMSSSDYDTTIEPISGSRKYICNNKNPFVDTPKYLDSISYLVPDGVLAEGDGLEIGSRCVNTEAECTNFDGAPDSRYIGKQTMSAYKGPKYENYSVSDY